MRARAIRLPVYVTLFIWNERNWTVLLLTASWHEISKLYQKNYFILEFQFESTSSRMYSYISNHISTFLFFIDDDLFSGTSTQF